MTGASSSWATPPDLASPKVLRYSRRQGPTKPVHHQKGPNANTTPASQRDLLLHDLSTRLRTADSISFGLHFRERSAQATDFLSNLTNIAFLLQPSCPPRLYCFQGSCTLFVRRRSIGRARHPRTNSIPCPRLASDTPSPLTDVGHTAIVLTPTLTSSFL